MVVMVSSHARAMIKRLTFDWDHSEIFHSPTPTPLYVNLINVLQKLWLFWVFVHSATAVSQNYSTSNVSYQFDTRTIHSKHSGLKMQVYDFHLSFTSHSFIPALPYLISMEEWRCIISLHIIQMYVEVISFLRLCFGGYNQHQGQWGSHSFIRDPCCCRSWVFLNISAQEYFFLKAHPAVSLHFPPCGWQRTKEQPVQGTTVWAWLKMVVIL